LTKTALKRPELSASVAVFRGGKVLLAQRMFAPYAGHYSLPGGRVERGESLREAALRELKEEVQVEASIIDFIDHVELYERDEAGNVLYHAVICVFLAHWISGEPQTGEEVSDIFWHDPLLKVDFKMTPRLGEIIAKATLMNKVAR
jgi:8-oxo-dGTP diphosphatase